MNNTIRSTQFAGNQDRENPVELSAQIDGSQKVSAPSLSVVTDSVNASRDCFWISIPLTTTAGLYTAGDSVGGLLVLPNVITFLGECSRLQQILIVDLDNIKAALDLIIWERNPVTQDGATVTNDSPLALGTSATRIAARLAIAAADYGTILTDAFACLKDLNLEVTSQYENTLYATLVCSGGPTYATVNGLSVRFVFQRD